MDINILKEFVSLVETKSFQETAFENNISQSALTKHIQKLESELGLPLFDRSTRSLNTNQYGEALYPYAKEIITDSQEALSVLQSLSNSDKNSFSVSYAPLLGQYGLIDVLAKFSQQYPESNMRLIETYKPFSSLKNKECDFAFMGENEVQEESNFNKIVYKKDQLAVILPLDHKAAGRTSVSLEELKNENFILHASVTNVPQLETQKFLELCEKTGFNPNVVTESQFTSTILDFVESGIGIAVLNRMHIPKEIREACAVVDISPAVYSYIYMLYRSKLSCPLALDFLHFMVEEIEKEDIS